MPVLVHELREDGGEEDRRLGVGDPDEESVGYCSGNRPRGRKRVGHRMSLTLQQRPHAEVDQVRGARQLHDGKEDGGSLDQRSETKRRYDCEGELAKLVPGD